MSDDIAIKVENLSKVYRLYDHPFDRLKESLHPFGRKFHRDFHALKDVSFEIKKGETAGIVGRNGSGKSTLLKLIAGVLTPSSGKVTVNGKVSALLELGAGFNPELSGLENVYFSGTVMGYSRAEMESRIDEILAFAGIGDYVHQPVKTYSSGMFVRLAFAVAVAVDPDILIVDEALAVGDMQFQKRCMDKMNEFRTRGKTIVFVSHNLYAIRVFCSYACLLVNGRVATKGLPDLVADRYIEDLDLGMHGTGKPIVQETAGRAVHTHVGDIASIVSVRLLDHENKERTSYRTGEKFVLEIQYNAKQKLPKPSIGMAVFNNDAEVPLRIASNNTKWQDASPDYIYDHGAIRFTWNELPLLPGNYSIWLTIKDEHDLITFNRIENAINFRIVGEDGDRGILRECGIMYCPGEWAC